MPLYTPPSVGANNGGFVIMTVTNGVRTHRMRFHVAPFAASTGTYTTAQGSEANVSTTAAALRGNIAPNYTAAFTIAWAALYQYQNGQPVQIPLTGSVATAAGTNAGSASAFAEAFTALSFKSSLGGRARFFLIEPAGWAYNAALTIANGVAGNIGGLVTYLTGSNTGVVAHDGGKYLSPAHITYGTNKKLRRRAGNA